MHALVRGAAAAAVLTAMNGLGRPPPPPTPTAAPAAAEMDGMPSFCSHRALPEGPACVPLPPPGIELDAAEALVPAPQGSPRQTPDTREQIPRRPDRPEDHALYRYPLALTTAPHILSGYDLDLPHARQRQGPGLRHTGHGGIDLAAPRGAEVVVVALDHQEGLAEVTFAGELFGLTVATIHMVREAGRLREYIALYGHLDGFGPGITPGTPIAPGEVLGYVGDSGSPGIVHLHFELRQVRDGIGPGTIAPDRLADNAVSVPCDPRNLLPLR